MTQHYRVLDTDGFDIVIGTDFLRRNPQVKVLSIQRPYSLHCDFGSGLFSVLLELSGREESGLPYASKTNYRTENYQFARLVLENGLAALQVNLDEIQVELFASQQQHIMQLYCSKQLKNAFCFFWKAMGLAYANPPFSLLAKVLTKIAYEEGRVVMCTPDWGCSGEHAYWRRMLDRMTVARVQLPDGPIFVPEDSHTAMQAPEWANFLSIVDGSLNLEPLCDLDQVLLKEVMAQNRSLTLSDLKNRYPEHLSATLTGCDSPHGYLKPAAVKGDADDELSEIASTIPPVDPSCVDLKHSAFLAQLLLEEVDLELTSEPASRVGKPVLHMQPMHTRDLVARSPGAQARPASNNMPLSEHDTQEPRQLMYLKAESIGRRERLQYLRGTWKSSIWSEEDDDSYTLPGPVVPLVFSLHYGQQCRSTSAQVPQRLEKTFPVYETDLSVRIQIEELPMLPEIPSAARVSEYLCDLEYLFSRMNVGSYGATEPHLWLPSNIPQRTWDDCRATSERKSRTHSYDELVDLLIEQALEGENDSHMGKLRKKHLGRGRTPTPERGEGKGPQIITKANQGGGKGRGNLRAMNEVKPDAGTPPLFYYKPVNDKGGPCHAPDCDCSSSCMLQMKRQQHSKDGKTVTHQDHFRCTITCCYCGKRRHYEDECHIKKRKSDKLKQQEAERQKTQTPTRNPPNGDKGGNGGGRWGGKGGPPNPQRRSSAPTTTPPPAAGDPKMRPQGDNASPEGSYSQKRRLAWMAKSLMAAGVDVKFPDEE